MIHNEWQKKINIRQEYLLAKTDPSTALEQICAKLKDVHYQNDSDNAELELITEDITCSLPLDDDMDDIQFDEFMTTVYNFGDERKRLFIDTIFKEGE